MYQLRTLGTLDLRSVDGHPVHSVLSQPKRAAILCYLAISNSHAFHYRERIAAVFWPESDAEHARLSLRQALHAVRRSLGEAALLTRGNDGVAICAAQVWCDAAELDRAFEAHRWAEVVELHRGPFLDGFHVADCEPFEQWAEQQRERLRGRAETAAWQCVDDCVAKQDRCGAVAWGQRALELAPTDEAALRRFMQLAMSLGDAVAAQQAYEHFAQRMRREYELELSPETELIARQLQAATPARAAALAAEAPAPRTSSPSNQAAAVPPAPRRTSSRLWRWLALAPIGVLAGVVGWLTLGPAEPAREPGIHATVTDGVRVTDRLVQWMHADISPDGRLIAYSHPQKGIVVRTIAGDSSWQIPSSLGAANPVFSPDSRQLVFILANTLYRWPLRGLAPLRIAPMEGGRIWWGADDWIYYALQMDGTGIWRMPSAGGVPEQLTKVRPGERGHVLPQLLPGGRAVLYTALGMSGGARGSRVVAQRIGDDSPRILATDAMYGRYLPSGHLLYADDAGTLYAIRFDPDRLETRGKAAAVQTDVGTATQLGEAFVDFSDNGTELYLERSSHPTLVYALSDRAGRATPFLDSAALALMGPVVFHGRISPDGERVVFTGMHSGAADLWMVTRGSEIERLTLDDDAEEERAAWSPDGNSIAYTATPARIMVMDLTNASKPRLVRRWSSHVHVSAWSPDGKWLLIQDHPTSTRRDLWAVSIDGKDSVAVATRPTAEWEGEFSPDGRWVAYYATEGSGRQVYVVSFPDTSIRRQVTTTGGLRPHWSPNGRELLYISGGKLISRSVEAGTGLSFGAPTELFPVYDYIDVSGDGQRFLLRNPNGNDTTDYPPLHIRTKWFDEIRAKVD